jgi:hypothetical protein
MGFLPLNAPASGGVTFPITVAQGGTGQTTPAAGLAALGGTTAPVMLTYAPATLQTLSILSTSFAAFSSGVVCTPPFNYPASGRVKVSVHCVAEVLTGSTGLAIALAAVGTVTPILGTWDQWQDSAVSQPRPYSFEFDISGTPGAAAQLDVLGASGSAADAITILALDNVTNPIVAGTRGGPVIVTVTPL